MDNVRYCFYEVPDASSKDLQPGRYAVEARYAHNFGRVLPHVDGYGWLGNDRSCAIVLGRVRSKSGLLPDEHIVQRLVSDIEAADEAGNAVLAEFV
mgnify:FL=1